MRRFCAVVAAIGLVGALVACDTDSPTPDEPAPHQPELGLPANEVTVLDDSDPAALALQVSQLLFVRAPVVVLASATDPASHEQAASTAEELGAPVLLVAAAGDLEQDDVAAELDRLQVEAVVTVGTDAEQWQRGRTDLAASPGAPEPAATLPPVTPAEPLTGLTVLAPADPDAAGLAAAVATARIAGATIRTTEATDPRADPGLIEALAADPPTHTIAFGTEFGPADRLHNRLAVATTGVQLPGGGQVMFPGRRLVALYGHPGDNVLGALGEQPLAETIERAQQVAAEYEPFVDEPVVPTFEIITTIASAAPGPLDDYSLRTPVDQLRPWVDAAAEAGIYVVLDLQPGHTDFLTQAQLYEELLIEPHVGLALDPEWRLAPNQRHMVNIGSVNSAEVNEVIDWLSELTIAHRLPQKLLIVHQFTMAMIQDRDDLDLSRDELAVMIHADGFGTPGQKFHTWEMLRRDAPDVWWGWKNFYDEDRPTFTPAETVDVEPSPWFISYQ